MREFLISCLALCLAGCFSFNFGTMDSSSNDKETNDTTIYVANPENVYRLSSNEVLRVKYQDKNGKWVDMKHPVSIPANWYIVSGAGIE